MLQSPTESPNPYKSLRDVFRRLRTSESPKPSASPTPASTPPVSRAGSSSSLTSLSSGAKQYGKKIASIGSGITAKVDVYYHKSTNQFYAIKTFMPRENYETRNDYKQRCYSEFDVVRNLHHTNLLKVYDFIPGFQTHQIVLEFAPYTLLKLIQLATPNEEEVSCFFRQTFEGLWFLHQNHIAHRDLKMENLVIDKTATVKLIDFGTAFTFGPEKKLAVGNVGTEALVSPEALSSLKYDSESNDVWGLGVLLYSMLNLSFPWKCARDSDPDYKAFKARKEVIRKKFPEWMWEPVSQVLEVDPAKRLSMKGLHDLVEVLVKDHTECDSKLHRNTIRICTNKLKHLEQ